MDVSNDVESVTYRNESDYTCPRSMRYGNGGFWITAAEGNLDVAKQMLEEANGHISDTIDDSAEKMARSSGNDYLIVRPDTYTSTIYTKAGNIGCITIIVRNGNYCEFAGFKGYVHMTLLINLKKQGEAERIRKLVNYKKMIGDASADDVKRANLDKKNATSEFVRSAQAAVDNETNRMEEHVKNIRTRK